MHKGVIDKRGKVTIPAQLRKKLRLKPGTQMSVSEENGHIVLIPF